MDQRSPQLLSSTAAYVAPPQHAPLAFSIPEASKVSGVGRTKIYEAIASGALPVRKNGAKNIILREDLERWLRNLPTERPAAPSPRHRAPAAA